MLINGKPFKEIMREKLSPEKVIRNREINHGDVLITENGENKTIMYCTGDGKTHRLEYVNNLLNKIYINNNLEFEY